MRNVMLREIEMTFSCDENFIYDNVETLMFVPLRSALTVKLMVRYNKTEEK
jgi:hypothetical protein